MLEKLLLPELREAVRSSDWKSLAEMCTFLHPSVIAQILIDMDDFEVGWAAFEHVDPQVRAQILEYLPDDYQDRLVERLPKAELARLLEVMAHDDRVDLVKRMDDDRQAEVMPLVARADREDILRLSKFAEGTAGSIMTTDYAALPADITVQEALSRLRREAPDRETIYYIFVIDEHRRLIGFVSLKDLILAKPYKKVSEVMREDVLYVRTDSDVEKAASDLARFDLIAIPVVDADQRLVGIITHDDVIDVVIEEATKDVHQMGAVQPLESEYLASSFWVMVRSRVVWLSILFCAEMLTSAVLSMHETLLIEFAALIVFMPVITATGGNSGAQSASLVTRALALGEVGPRDWFRIARREFFSGVALGGAVGVLGLFAVYLFHRDVPLIALVLLLALITVTTCGSLVGSLMPLVFKRFGLDPAISSSPFVACMVDVVGLFLYCTIAALILYGLR